MNLINWLDELGDRPISWQLLVVIVVGAAGTLLIGGHYEWRRRLRKWVRERGYELISFRRANTFERRSLERSFGDWDSDWLEVLLISVRDSNGKERTALISFKIWLGVGPYRVRDFYWKE